MVKFIEMAACATGIAAWINTHKFRLKFFVYFNYFRIIFRMMAHYGCYSNTNCFYNTNIKYRRILFICIGAKTGALFYKY